MLLGSYLAAPLLFVAGTVWPAYSTYKATVSQEADAMTRWLQYWLIAAILSLVDGFLDSVGAFLPFYWEAKLAFTLWLVMDKFKGASLLCTKYIQPFLADKTGVIDEQIDFVSARASNLKVDDLRTFVQWVQSKDMRAVLETASTAAKKAVADATSKEQSTDKPEEPEVVDVSEAEEKKAK